MPRSVLALILCCLALQAAAAAAAPPATSCLAAWIHPPRYNAGGDVSDKELTAAQSACAQLKQSTADSKILARVNTAAERIANEAKQRQNQATS